jgi:hypothetical protein
MGPATPAMTGIECSTVHAIQDRSVKHLPGQDRHPMYCVDAPCQADDGGRRRGTLPGSPPLAPLCLTVTPEVKAGAGWKRR